MKHEVVRDFGVDIGGVHYKHGAVIDSDKLVPDFKEPPRTDKETDDAYKARAEAMKKAHGGKVEEANAQHASFLKDGSTADLMPYTEPAKPAEAAAPKKKGE